MDTLILTWAIHRIGGGCLMLQPTSSTEEMAAHLNRIPPVAFFATLDLLSLGQEALKRSSIPSDLPFYKFSESYGPVNKRSPVPEASKIPSLDALIAASKHLPPLPKVSLAAGEASRRVAYYCTTSGTSGFQVMIRSFFLLIARFNTDEKVSLCLV